MEDEYRSTLRKKISILFQLGKWLDVVKLCESYTEKYGKDMEIDLIRFKSERHLGIAAPSQANQPQEKKKAAGPENDQPPQPAATDAANDDVIVLPAPLPEKKQGPADLVVSTTAADELPFVHEDKMAYDPSEEDVDLIITDPFADNEPGFSLAPDEPPVILSERDESESMKTTDEPAPVTTDAGENPAESPEEEMEIDFKSLGSVTIDADPQLTPDEPTAQPSAAAVMEREEALWEDLTRSTSGGVEVLEEPEEGNLSAKSKPAAAERLQDARGTFPEFIEKKQAARKNVFKFKLVLLIVLPLIAAMILWLALSGKLNFSGGETPEVNPVPAAKPVVAKRPPLTRKIPPTAQDTAAAEIDKAFAEKLQQASELYKKGDILKAWAVVLEAKKIKMTEPLRLLEEQLAAKIQADEAQAKQESQVVQNQWQLESQAYARAEAENTLAGWQNFLKTYPQGEFAFKADQRITALQKKAQENSDQQLLLRIQQAQKTKLRSAYLSMGQADIAAMLRLSGRPSSQFEAHGHGGATVMLDYSSGLMWTLWNKPMDYHKAKWWANRVTAGYGGWRLPTAEEAVSLLQMDRAQYSGLPGFSVWTGDTVSDQPRTAWVLKLPEGQFAAAGYEQVLYVWSVRKAGK